MGFHSKSLSDAALKQSWGRKPGIDVYVKSILAERAMYSGKYPHIVFFFAVYLMDILTDSLSGFFAFDPFRSFIFCDLPFGRLFDNLSDTICYMEPCYLT